MTIQDDVEDKLNRICAKCGEHYGRHKFNGGLCPVRDDIQPQRFVGYREDQVFEEWVE